MAISVNTYFRLKFSTPKHKLLNLNFKPVFNVFTKYVSKLYICSNTLIEVMVIKNKVKLYNGHDETSPCILSLIDHWSMYQNKVKNEWSQSWISIMEKLTTTFAIFLHKILKLTDFFKILEYNLIFLERKCFKIIGGC